MASLTMSKVGPLRKAIAESARTDQTNASEVSGRFKEISAGLVDKLGAKRHHMLTGRRGTGKSTHLHHVRVLLETNGTAAPLIDMEVFKDRQYPDVLLEILIAILDAIKPGWSFRKDDIIQRRRVSKLRRKLVKALSEPQSLTHRYAESSGSKRGVSVVAGLKARARGVGVEAGAEAAARHAQDVSRTAEFEGLKIDRMKELAGEISTVLSGLVAHSAEKSALIFLDDFYFVRLSDQADVLDFLHRIESA